MRRTGLLLILLALGGCQDPFERPGTWSLPPANGLSANDANLHTMVANPRDLMAGTGEDNAPAAEAAPPVRRLLTGRRPALPDTNASTIQNSGGSQGAPAGPAGSNASQ